MRNEPTENVVLSVSKEELGDLIERSVRRALDDAGLSLEDRDAREEAREDFRFLRFARRSAYSAAAKIGLVFITICAGAVLAVIWTGIKVHVLRQP